MNVNEDRRFYTIRFLLPDGNEHIVITRYSALLSFYQVGLYFALFLFLQMHFANVMNAHT